MKGQKVLTTGVAVGLLAVMLAGLTMAQEPVGWEFTYQGRLTDNGSPANDEYDLRFRLYDAATEGTLIGTDSHENVPVNKGLFTVQLDYGSNPFGGEARWLEIGVRPGDSGGSYTLLEPRQELTAAPYASHALGAPWSGLSGVPAGLDDGDDDTTYTAGAGLSLTGTEFSVDTDQTQARVDGVCGVGYAVRAVNEDGSVECAWVDNTAYTAGNGLLLTGTEFSVDEVKVQSRVTGACGAGSAIRTINQDGTVACEADDDTTYSAGDGLSLTGTEFSVDTSKVQSRVSGACGAGYAIRTINQSGSVVCELDNDTTYTAGEGLVLVGGQFQVEFAGSGIAKTAARSDHDHWGQSWSGSGVGLTLSGGSRGLMASGSEYGVYADGGTADLFLADSGVIRATSSIVLVSDGVMSLTSDGFMELTSHHYVELYSDDDVIVRLDDDHDSPDSEFGIYTYGNSYPLFSVSELSGVGMRTGVDFNCDACVGTADVEDDSLSGDDVEDDSLTGDDVQDGSLSADDVDPSGGIYSTKDAIYLRTKTVPLPAGSCIDLEPKCDDANDLPLQGVCSPPSGAVMRIRWERLHYWNSTSLAASYACQICNDDVAGFTVEASIACIAKP